MRTNSRIPYKLITLLVIPTSVLAQGNSPSPAMTSPTETSPAPTLPAPTIDAAALIAGTAGQWTGELQYRDYQSNTWQGLPVEIGIVAQPDGVTTVRTAAYDDGPQTGTVWITTTAIIDPATGTQRYVIMRRGRDVDAGTAQLTVTGPTADASHWSVVATSRQRDGNSMAAVRETTTRDGDTITTLKEVNPDDDGSDQWLPRNRTIITRVR